MEKLCWDLLKGQDRPRRCMRQMLSRVKYNIKARSRVVIVHLCASTVVSMGCFLVTWRSFVEVMETFLNTSPLPDKLCFWMSKPTLFLLQKGFIGNALENLNLRKTLLKIYPNVSMRIVAKVWISILHCI